jgi:hypothetical protein
VNGSCLLPRLPDYSARGAICAALLPLCAQSAPLTPRMASARVARTPHTPRHPAPSGLCHTLFYKVGCPLTTFQTSAGFQ